MHKHYPISKLNSWRLGSSVRYFSEPRSQAELLDVYYQYAHIPTIWLGLGSNILFPDHELSAHIIKTHKALNRIEEQETIYAEAGVPLAKLARFCVKKGYEDAAFFAGIPGTVGGALIMNAGAYHHDIWRYVSFVTVLTTKGLENKTAKDFLISYRKVQLPKDFIAFISVNLQFKQQSIESGLQKIKHYLLMRNQTQPIGTFNCGSVFRNPVGRSAGHLIDSLGLKGYSIGGAAISPMHGNFIENVDQASSKDIKRLIQLMQYSVWSAYHIHLTLEVKVYE